MCAKLKIPMVLFVGKKKSGKTKFLEGLIAELVQKDYRVGTLKHHGHDAEPVDEPNSDSWRHQRAGAAIAVLSSNRRISYFFQPEEKWSLTSLCQPFEEKVDIILAEGFKQESFPKIEVLHFSKGGTPLCSSDPHIIAIVSDVNVDLNVQRFAHNEIAKAANFIENRFLK